jgi:hypothetical protein
MRPYFETKLAIRAIDELVWELTEDLIFVDSKGRRWVIPKGFRCDMNSTPRLFWIFMPPSSGTSDSAAALHDMVVRFRNIFRLSYMECHDLFLQGHMATCPYGNWFQRTRRRIRRNIAYGAVVIGNWVCLDAGFGLHRDDRYNAPNIVSTVMNANKHLVRL